MAKKYIQLQTVVIVKAVVTQAFKDKRVNELEESIRELKAEGRKENVYGEISIADLMKNGQDSQIPEFKRQLDEKACRREAKIKHLQKKIEKVKNSSLYTEIIEGGLKGTINIAVGDNLYKKIRGAEILVKDDIVKEIREEVEIIQPPPLVNIISRSGESPG
jgi:hypothetical protein